MTVKASIKGAKAPEITLESITSQVVTLVGEASASFETYDATCLRIATLMVDLRQLHTFEGRKARKNEIEHDELTKAFKAHGVPSGIDWRGESKAYKDDLEKVWNAALAPIVQDVTVWQVRTGGSPSNYPLRKNVDYYVENVLRERMGAEEAARYGLVPGTRAERAKRAAEKRQEQGNNGVNQSNSTVDGGKPVAAILLTQADSLTKGLEAALKHPLPINIAFELIQKLKALTTVADQYQEAVLSPPATKAS